MNIPLLRKVKAHILAEPKRLFMDRLIALGRAGSKFKATRHARQVLPPCGTAACIAGWTLILSGEPKEAILGASDPNGKTFHRNEYLGADAAEQLLDLTEDQADNLFFVFSWPDKFRDAYNAAKTPKQRARIAAQRIDHLIATGE